MRYLLLVVVVSCCLDATSQTVRPYAPELFPEDLSGAVCGFSKDGNTIYFVREQPITHKLWIYEAKRNGRKWLNEKLLPFSGVYSDQGGRFNHDRTEFYFTSDRPGGSDNDKDVWNIWKVSKTSIGWGVPVPLKQINSKGMECCAVPLSNGMVLFSGTRDKSEWQILICDSNGDNEKPAGDVNLPTAWQWPSFEHVEGGFVLLSSMKRDNSLGMDDIYLAPFKNGKLGKASNVAAPFNTRVYEDGAIMTPDNRLIIFNRHETAEAPSRVMCVDDWKFVK